MLGLAGLMLAACGTGAGADRASGALDAQVVATIEIGRAYSIAAGSTGVWAANYEDGEVVLVDPQTERVKEAVPVRGVLGSGVSDVHPVGDDIWLAASDSRTVGHLNATSLELTAAVDPGPASFIDMAAAPGELWLAQSSGMKQLRPTSAHGSNVRSANSLVPPPGEKYAVYSDIAAGDAGVWALDESEGTLAAISPAAGDPRVVATGEARFRGAQAEIAVGLGYVWVETSSGGSSQVARYDPVSSEITTLSVDGQDGVMAVGTDALWVLTHDDDKGFLWRVDPATLETAEPLVLSGEFQSGDIAFGFGSVWVSHDFNYLTRIDSEARDPAPSPTVARRGNGDVCDQGGPWVDCSPARWLERVVTHAGYRLSGDTGSALEVIARDHAIYAWNAVADRPAQEVARDEGYEPHPDLDAYSDGTRLFWEVRGLHVYLESMTGGSIDDIPDDVIRALIESSRAVPREADLSGAKPQPSPDSKQRSETLPNGNVRVWPASRDVPNEGKYLFEIPHCGLDWMTDFDGSFWDPIQPDDYGDGEGYPFFYNSDEGAITFQGDDVATYQASTGEEVRLERIEGPIEIQPCA